MESERERKRERERESERESECERERESESERVSKLVAGHTDVSSDVLVLSHVEAVLKSSPGRISTELVLS